MHFQRPEATHTFIVFEIDKLHKTIFDQYVLKNCIVLHPLKRDTKYAYAKIGKDLWDIEYSELIREPNMIYLNKIQREYYRKKFNDTIRISFVESPLVENIPNLKVELSRISKSSIFFSNLMDNFHNITTHIQQNIQEKILTYGQPFCVKLDDLSFKIIISSENIVMHNYFKLNDDGIVEVVSFEGQDISFVNEDHIPIKSWNLYDKGIGGMKDIADSLFRRAFVSRMIPTQKVKEIGAKHTKGVLLYGPPGTGKTLLARTIASLLNKDIEPKIVSGPEIFNKYVGESQKKVRELFQDAEQDQKTYGDKSPLHVIIFDEFDSIGKKRSTSDSTGSRVENDVVNQLLSKMDGVEQLHNLLVIALTNRKDIIDSALLRPGRFEIQIEVKLPTFEERIEIFEIHCSNLIKSNSMAEDVDLLQLAKLTDNYTGAEIEGIVKSACSFAMSRVVDLGENGGEISYDKDKDILVTNDDFNLAFQDITPQFGIQQHKMFKKHFEDIVLPDKLNMIYDISFQTLLIHSSKDSNKIEDYVGKFAITSDIKCLYCVDYFSLIGMNEYQKSVYIKDVYVEASKTKSALIVINNLETIIGFKNFINSSIIQTIITLVRYYDHIKTIVVCRDFEIITNLGLNDNYYFDKIVEI